MVLQLDQFIDHMLSLPGQKKIVREITQTQLIYMILKYYYY